MGMREALEAPLRRRCQDQIAASAIRCVRHAPHEFRRDQPIHQLSRAMGLDPQLFGKVSNCRMSRSFDRKQSLVMVWHQSRLMRRVFAE
jgi:hypothetical protein